MRKKKLLLICFAILFLTGCDMQYKIIINKDGRIDEYINLSEENSVIESNQIDIQGLIDEKHNKYNRTIGEYTSNIKDIDNRKLVENYTKYDNLDKFKLESKALSRVISNFTSKKQNKRITLTGKLIYPKSLEEIDMIDNVYFKISLPFVVLNHNADTVTGTTVKEYSWLIDPYDTTKEIELLYDTNRVNVIKDNKLMEIDPLIIWTILIGFALFLGILWVINRFKVTNRF